MPPLYQTQRTYPPQGKHTPSPTLRLGIFDVFCNPPRFIFRETPIYRYFRFVSWDLGTRITPYLRALDDELVPERTSSVYIISTLFALVVFFCSFYTGYHRAQEGGSQAVGEPAAPEQGLVHVQQSRILRQQTGMQEGRVVRFYSIFFPSFTRDVFFGCC